MTALLIAALLQAPTVDDHIAAFLKGDAASRGELLKLGVYAIRPLQKARDKNPEKIDGLVFELKKAAAFPQSARFDEDLGEGVSRGGGGRFSLGFVGMMGFDTISFFMDPFDTSRIGSQITVEGRTARKLAEDICKQTGLDYGYFHNAIVFAHPDRLWPPLPHPDKGEVTGAALERAKSLVNQLNHELIETREAASRQLLGMGRGLAPFLREQLKRSEPEIAARCRLLIQELTPKRGAYGPAAACRQALDEPGRFLLRRLSDSKISLTADEQTLKRIIDNVNVSQPIVCEIPDEWASKKSSIQVRAISVMDFLSLLTQSLDLDFMVKGTGILIDTREAIQRAISKESK